MQRIANEKILKKFLTTSEEEKDRHALFDFAAPRRGEFIREAIEQAESLRTDR